MDRNNILQSFIDSFKAYSYKDDRDTIEKVLKYSGNPFDIQKRGDIGRELVTFRYLNGKSDYLVEDEKPRELIQRVQAIIFIEQSDNISSKEWSYDRMLELSDQLIDWLDETSACEVSTELWSMQFSGVDAVQERDGYVTSNVNFQTTIKIRE